MKFDTLALVETPEGVDLQAEPVGLVPRALAYSIDLFIRLGVILVCAIVFAFMGKAGSGLLLIIYFVLEWWYPVLFEVFKDGQTPGKKSFNIKVVNDDLTPVSFSASLTRNLLRTVDLLPNFYLFGAISMTVSKRFQRLGDLAAGTIVIYEPTAPITNLDNLANTSAIAPQQALSEELQTAFINFSINRGRLSADRQQEIAEIIRPKLPQNVTSASDYVRGVGKWLLGAKSD